MARWKLSRIKYGSEELSLSEGDVASVGRSPDNKLSISSLVISRNHCVFNADRDKLTVTDLQSSNGVYVGLVKIPPHVPYPLKDRDILGIGWTQGAPVTDIKDAEKYMFKVTKVESMPNRIKFEMDIDPEDIKKELELNEPPIPKDGKASPPSKKLFHLHSSTNKENLSNSTLNNILAQPSCSKLITGESKPNLKRKINEASKIKEEPPETRKRLEFTVDDTVIHISDSDSDIELPNNLPKETEKPDEINVKQKNYLVHQHDKDKVNSLNEVANQPDEIHQNNQIEEAKQPAIKEEVKMENDLEYFHVKHEFIDYDEEAIQIDSESDSESEQWLMRLSQSSPGKPFLKAQRESQVRARPDENSYSQMDDFVVDLDDEDESEEYEHDIITIPNPPPPEQEITKANKVVNMEIAEANKVVDMEITEAKKIVDVVNEKSEISDVAALGKPSVGAPNIDSDEDFLDDIISLKEPAQSNAIQRFQNIMDNEIKKEIRVSEGKDVVDNVLKDDLPAVTMTTSIDTKTAPSVEVSEKPKSTLLIKPEKSSDKQSDLERKHKSSSSSRRKHKHSSSKRHISNSQKEERKKKLKEIAKKEIDAEPASNQIATTSKSTANVKVTSQTNRGAFLFQAVKPMKRIAHIPLKEKEKSANSSNDANDFKPTTSKSKAITEHKRRHSKETKSDTKSNKAESKSDKAENKLGIGDSKSGKVDSKLGKADSKSGKDDSKSGKVDIKPGKVDIKCDKADSKIENTDKPDKDNSKLDKVGSKTHKVEKNIRKSDKGDGKSDKAESKSDKRDNKSDKDKTKSKSKQETKRKSTDSVSDTKNTSTDFRIPLKNLKPLSDSQTETFSGKPFSKVEPFAPKKVKKTVRFSDDPPKVHVFEIEEGNKMKKTSLAKSTLVDVRQRSSISLEKITLGMVLRWNPHWLVEQMNFTEPPPILGHNEPMAIFHFFNSHKQYVGIIGDLLLMEIWEALTEAHGWARSRPGLPMRIAHFPPPPAPDRLVFELFTISVNVSVPSTEMKTIPRAGDLLSVTFGPDNAKTLRFFFVHNVRLLPSPPNNVNSFFCISLQCCYTDKMKNLKQGELMAAVNLGNIQQTLLLYEAMENLAGSPLLDVIIRPEPRHFQRIEFNPLAFRSNYPDPLNPSQLRAVAESVSAALSDKPCINMIQGPPGTGKSTVICAIVMSYFNDANLKRSRNRGKILICATSNAAVDEITERLLKKRQQLPQPERFKLVRVGRQESMHQRVVNVSSQVLAKRDAESRQKMMEPAKPGLGEEISHLEAKMNMWKSQAQDAKDPVRVAYCQQRVTQLITRIALLRTGGGAGRADVIRSEQLQACENRIIEGADIIVTTLSSAQNPKLRGLKRRIALCIVDEAGQAIEPETLIPLTLDVTKLTLVGDPQQLQGYICSQIREDSTAGCPIFASLPYIKRAKKYGLGASLFSRISSCTDHWPVGSHNPIIMLNQQYRMHPDIADYPNRAFYDSRIMNAGALTTMPRPNLGIPPYLILSIYSGDNGQGSCGGNEIEAWGVARLVASLQGVAKRAGDLSLGVITPYNGHKELIKKKLRIFQEPGAEAVDVNTVDSFQGQERDVIVVSLARSQGVGFLTDSGRMNVMLTRAKHALIVCLNPHAMLKNLQWRTLVEDAQRRNMFRVLPNNMCMGPAGGDRDDILRYVAVANPRPARN